MRSVVSRSLQIETVFHVMLQHRTIRYFSACCLQIGANGKLILSCCHHCFLWFKFSEDKHWYSFMPPALLLTKRISTLTAFSIPRSTRKGHHADVWGNRLPFPPKTKNNFSGIDISQPTPSMSLSVPSFSLDVLNIFACSVNLFFTQLVLQDFAFFSLIWTLQVRNTFLVHASPPPPPSLNCTRLRDHRQTAAYYLSRLCEWLLLRVEQKNAAKQTYCLHCFLRSFVLLSE